MAFLLALVVSVFRVELNPVFLGLTFIKEMWAESPELRCDLSFNDRHEP